MKHFSLTKVSLRYNALFLDIDRGQIDMQSPITESIAEFVSHLNDGGFCLSEELLHALNAVPVSILDEITLCIIDVMGENLNWAPLVKGWDEPTGESLNDHLVTMIANIFGSKGYLQGTTLPCGHLIPDGTFPLERYNGCPFCGKQFTTADFVYKGQGSKLKELRLFTRPDMEHVFTSLLTSLTPLDATQQDSLALLLPEFPLPAQVRITMKETAMLVVKLLVQQNRADEATLLLATPDDVLRYLWYEKTGLLKIIEPKTLIAHARKLYSHIWGPLDSSSDAAAAMKSKLRLKYNRQSCLRVARWLNAIPMSPRQAAENMHSKRGMWVRLIRALRLAEYARKSGFDNLAAMLDVFYRQDYQTWQGKVDTALTENNPDTVLALLKQRPGMFARALFATMLHFGSERTLAAFGEVADNIPARLLLSLTNAANEYFFPADIRIARPITGGTHEIKPNKLLVLYNKQAREQMVADVNTAFMESLKRRYAARETEAHTIYIDPMLHLIPLSVGDRATTISDTTCALQGTRFPVQGNNVRLFMQWGKGLHAQHLDMDLSCIITLPNDKTASCCYYNLTCVGAKHSGDIRTIPEMVGTAEYIELSLPELKQAGAKYAVFTCNAYSSGALSPNLVVGWMDSAYPMKVSEKTGVAYDPSCVQHAVRISESNLSKGLVFGVLDVALREIIWLEMPFMGQNIDNLNVNHVEALLRRLNAKGTIGALLNIKAEAQGLTIVDNPDDADEAYTYNWALNPADVTKLFDI